jgi:hypothetical protein
LQQEGVAPILLFDPASIRSIRDIHTASQQVQGRPEHFETVGQYLLGLDPGSTMWL